MSAPTRRSSATPTPGPTTDPREQAMSDALERARAARRELQELRRRREEAIRRADEAIRSLRGEEQQANRAGGRVQDALDAIDRVTRIPTPGERG